MRCACSASDAAENDADAAEDDGDDAESYADGADLDDKGLVQELLQKTVIIRKCRAQTRCLCIIRIKISICYA